MRLPFASLSLVSCLTTAAIAVDAALGWIREAEADRRARATRRGRQVESRGFARKIGRAALAEPVIATAAVARMAPDGYSLLVCSSAFVVNPSLYNTISYNIDKDFIPVTKAGFTPNSWVVNPKFPAKTMRELIDLIKKEPGKHSVGSPGTGTTPSLSIEMLKQALKLDFVTVPFKGGGPMTTSLLGGHTP